MTKMPIEEAFELNPKVSLPKGRSAPFVNMASISPFTRDVRPDEVKPYSGGMKFCDGDVLMARITPSLENGKTSIYRSSPEFRDSAAFGSTEFIVIRGRKGISDTRFAFYVFTSPEIREHAINSMNGSSGRQRVQLDSLASYVLDLPPLPEQRAIAATLGALDDKIESNKRSIEKLDGLFHSFWRQVYDNENTREVPLKEQVSTQYGLTASASDDEDGYKFLRVTDINKQNWIEWAGVPSVPKYSAPQAKYFLEKGDLLVARMADPGKSAIYDDDSIPAVFASYLVRLKPRSYKEGLYLYGFLKSREYREYALGATTGSVQKNMNARVIVDTMLRWPSNDALDRFAIRGASIRHKMAQLVTQNEKLARTRDALLPDLLSGRIRVPMAEEIL